MEELLRRVHVLVVVLVEVGELWLLSCRVWTY